MKRRKFQSSIKLLSYANVFSGGLFISMALIHLLPEATLVFNSKQSLEHIKSLQVYNNDSSSEDSSEIMSISLIYFLIWINYFNLQDGINYRLEDKICQSPNYFPFPWAFLITIITITFCLFIEKVSFASNYGHSHSATAKSPFRSKL